MILQVLLTNKFHRIETIGSVSTLYSYTLYTVLNEFDKII